MLDSLSMLEARTWVECKVKNTLTMNTLLLVLAFIDKNVAYIIYTYNCCKFVVRA